MIDGIYQLEKDIWTKLFTFLELQIVNHWTISCIFHEQEYMKLVMEMPICFDDIRMIDNITDFKFSYKLIDHLILLNGWFHDLFEGANKIGFLVFTNIDLTKLSGTDTISKLKIGKF